MEADLAPVTDRGEAVALMEPLQIREGSRRTCWVDEPASGEPVRVKPGELRKRDVRVGRHVAVSPGAVPRFLDRFEAGYSKTGKAETILSSAAAA